MKLSRSQPRFHQFSTIPAILYAHLLTLDMSPTTYTHRFTVRQCKRR